MREDKSIRLFYIVAVAAYVLTAAWVTFEQYSVIGKDITVCPIRRFLGIECPACGTTRSLMYVLDGDIFMAARTNINGLTAAAGIIAATLLLVYDMTTRRQLTYRLCMKLNAFVSTPAGKAFCVLYVVALIAGKFIGRMIPA